MRGLEAFYFSQEDPGDVPVSPLLTSLHSSMKRKATEHYMDLGSFSTNATEMGELYQLRQVLAPTGFFKVWQRCTN